MSRVHSVVRTLRSRKLAVVLLAAVALYSVVGTLVPQESVVPAEKLTAWKSAHPLAESVAAALSLHHAFSSPLFLFLCAFLALSTGFCAFERTRRAVRLSRGLVSPLSETVRRRLAERPDAVVAVPVREASEPMLERVARALSARGLRVGERTDEAIDARAGVLGLLGSPVFHWSLVLLMLVIALGQMTRAEGFLALPLETRVADAHESYLQVSEGPWFAERHTGVEFEMTEMNRQYTSGRTNYGPSPYVVAYRDGKEIAAGWVHANRPLRIGPLMLHMYELGPAVTLVLESEVGAEIARQMLPIDTSEETTSGTVPVVFDLSDASGQSAMAIRLQVLNKLSAGAVPGVGQAIVETGTANATTFGAPVTLGVGDAIELPGGQRLRVVEIGDWVRVSLANDWSVPWIYALLMLAIVGLAIALLVPARRASVLYVSTQDGPVLHVSTWHDKRDPLFAERVIEAVTAAVNEPEV